MIARAIFDTSGCDRFDIVEAGLISDKESYRIGEAIEIRLRLRSNEPRYIRLFEEKWRSVSLSVSPKEFRRYHELKGLVEYSIPGSERKTDNGRSIPDKERIEKIRIDENNPYELKIAGVIHKDIDTGQIVFDFREYGRFVILQRGSLFSIAAYLRPIDPHPLDPLEDYSDPIMITVTE